jgi:UDP-N-acetyl-D-galactosamine dehydrogenase
MLKRRIQVDGANVLVMGLTFKENCPDIRNTKVVDIINELRDFNVNIDIYDPWASAESAKHEYGLNLTGSPAMGKYDGIIVAVAHRQFKEMGVAGVRSFGKDQHVFYDLKCIFEHGQSDLRL